MRRSVTYTDAVFQQLMEAHRNSTACLHATTGGAAATTTAVGGRRKAERSDLLTVKNFGSRTGLHWPEDRVAREIAGYAVFVRSRSRTMLATKIVETRPTQQQLAAAAGVEFTPGVFFVYIYYVWLLYPLSNVFKVLKER